MDARQEQLRTRLAALGFDDVRFVALARSTAGRCATGSRPACRVTCNGWSAPPKNG